MRRSLEGRLTKAQRFVPSELLHRLDEVRAAILRVNEPIEAEVRECRDPFVAEAVKLLQTIPGVHLIRRLERLGLKVTVESLEGAA